MQRIAFPIACEFFGGLLVLLCTFVIVITSDSVIDLFKDFAAMQVISQLDDMMFWLALHGYTGKDMAHGAKQARKIRIHDREIKTLCGIPFRTIILMFIFGLMGGGWGEFSIDELCILTYSLQDGYSLTCHRLSCLVWWFWNLAYFVHGQVSGEFFKLKFPHCQIPDDSEVSYMDMGDKICNGPLNNIGEWHSMVKGKVLYGADVRVFDLYQSYAILNILPYAVFLFLVCEKNVVSMTGTA